jgi:hypothetical protein
MRMLTGIVLLVCFVPALQGADEENPLKKSKVGDWTEYRMTGPSMDGKTRLTVIAKDDKEVTYEVTGKMSFNGKEMAMPAQKQKVDLTKPYDAISAANLARTGTKIETVGEGTEKLKIRGKEYDTKWTKLKATTTVGDVTVVSEYKMWFSKSVPVSGLVRMDTDTAGTATKMELVGSGNGK